MKRSRSPIDQIEWMRNLLAFLLVGAFIFIVPALFVVVIPEQNKEIVTYMVGQLSGMALTALGFYFVNKVGQDALDASRSENTGKAFEAVTKALKATPSEDDEDALKSGDTVTVEKDPE